MANQGDQTVFIGNSDWFRGDPVSIVPQTELSPEAVKSMVGGYVRIDGSSSYSLDEEDVLYWEWELLEAPVDSSEGLGSINPGPYTEWFKTILTKEVLSVGRYQYQLQIRGANGGYGVKKLSFVISTITNAPLFDNIALDSSWVWQLLPDFWSSMPFEDRHKLEVLWRGVSQAMGSDLLNLYSVDNNKSIATIQDRVLKRWKRLDLDLPTSDSPIRVNRVRSAHISFDLTNPHLPSGSSTFYLDILNSPDWADLIRPTHLHFTGNLISGNELIPDFNARSEFYPSHQDIGAKLLVTIGNNTVETKVTYIDFNWRGKSLRARYLLKDDVYALLSMVDSRSSIAIKCSLVKTVTSIFPLPVMLGDDQNPNKRPALILNFNPITSLTTISEPTALNVEHTKITAYPNLLVKEANREGVSLGDSLYVAIERLNSPYKAAIKFKVLGCVKGEKANDDYYVMFDTLKTDFLNLALKALSSLHPDNVEVPDVFLGLSKSLPFILRSESSVLNDPSVESSLFLLSQGDTLYGYKIYPHKITRTSRIGLDADILNLVKASEFIEEHEVDGKGSIITDANRSRFLRRDPIFLIENRDFYIQPPKILGYFLSCDTSEDSEGRSIFRDLKNDFLLLGVEPGDRLVITEGLGVGEYTLLDVGRHYVKVAPTPKPSLAAPGVLFEGSEYTIYPKFLSDPSNPYNKYLVLNADILDVTTPPSLWIETYTENNDSAINLNFGSLASFSYEDWLYRSLTTSYKSAVTGLLAARMLGSSLDSIARAVGIVSGIPYAEERGRVLQIDKEAEVDSRTGRATRFKVILEGLDKNGVSTDNIRTYSIPARTDLTHQKTSGLSLGTGLDGRLAIGDILEQFELVGLGVAIEDIIVDPRKRFSDVKDRHRFRVSINYDSTDINTAEDVDFIYDFVVDIKPAYVEFLLSFIKYLVDFIEIQSKVRLKYKSKFFDHAYLLRGPAEIYDDEIPGRAVVDTPTYNVLSTWFPSDGIVKIVQDKLVLHSEIGYFTPESIESGILSVNVAGSAINLVHGYTSNFINEDGSGDPVISWIRGSVEIADSNRLEDYTWPDYVVFRGQNEGVYKINRVIDKHSLELDPISPTYDSLALFEEENVPFVVVRIATEIVYAGNLHKEGMSGVHLLGEGIIHDGLAAYDELGFIEDSVNRYVLDEFVLGSTDVGVPAIFIHPDQRFPRIAHQYPTKVVVRRPQLAVRDRGYFQVVQATGSLRNRGNNLFILHGGSVGNLHAAGVNVGDKVEFSYLDHSYVTYIVGIYGSLVWFGNSFDLPNEPITVKVSRDSALSGSSSLDQPEGMVRSNCSIILRSTQSARRNRFFPDTLESKFIATVDKSYSLVIRNELSPDLSDEALKSIDKGDLLKINSIARNGTTSEDFTGFTFDEGDGLVRVVEASMAEQSPVDLTPSVHVLLAQELPITSANFVGLEFSVKIIKQARLSSVYWRF